MNAPCSGWKLALFCDRFPELSETFVTGEARELARSGVDLTVYAGAPNRRDDSWDDDVEVYPLETGLRGDVRNSLPVARLGLRHPLELIRDVRAQPRWRTREAVAPMRRLAPMIEHLLREGTRHIHVHFAAEASLAALRASRLTGIPFSITAHAYELFQRPANLAEKFAEAAFVTVPCAYNAAELERRGLASPRMHVRMLGTDTEAIRRTTPLPREGLTLAVGRLIEKKGFHVLIEAAARKDFGPICIVGDGPWRGRLERLVAAHRLGDRVVLAGAVAPSEVRRWMEKAGLLVVPSVVAAEGDQDALPVVLWEALAMELPVVGTAVAGIPEVARPPWGTIVAPDDADALAGAIAGWHARPYADRLQAGRAGRRWLERHHTRRHAVDQLLGHISESPPPRDG